MKRHFDLHISVISECYTYIWETYIHIIMTRMHNCEQKRFSQSDTLTINLSQEQRLDQVKLCV